MPARAKKVAVSLDGQLLVQAESVQRETGETRSALFSRALRLLLRTEKQKEQIKEYIRAYEMNPETTADVDAARKQAQHSMRHLPWDDE